MRSLHSCALVALVAASGCISSAQTTPNYDPEYAGVSSGPDDPNFNESSWTGPPGGAMDDGYGYADPNIAGSPSQNPAELSALPESGAYGGDAYGGQTYGNAWADPASQGEWTGATADVTDGEIDQTLTGYGEWVVDADYGNVWRPDATIVGADFTPYESCGSWVYTDYGWTFQSCDAWSWGWLAFHYGRWVFLDDSWCWSRDYTWGPGWVDWRSGGDYVGWRPMRPTRQIRDHRDRNTGPLIRDHRRNPTEKWSFNHVDHFGRGPTRPTTLGVRDGLRATTSVAQPPIRGDFRARASTVMAGRLRDHQRFNTRTARDGQIGQSTRGYNSSAWDNTRGYNTRAPSWNNTRGYNAGGPRPNRGYNPTYNPTVVTPDRSRPTWQSTRPYTGPTRGYNNGASGPTRGYNAPTNNGAYGSTRGYNAPTNNGAYGSTRGYNAPTRPSYTGPTRNYNAPSRPSYTGPTRNYNAPSRPSYTGPTRNYNAPSRPSYTGPTRSYNAPSRPSYSGPTRSYSAPSRSSSPSPSRSYSAPSRSSSSSSSSGSSRSSSSSSGSSHSSGGSRGGGGRHR